MSLNPSDSDLNFQYLQLQFARLDVMLHRQVERVQTMHGADVTDRGLSSFGISEKEAFELLQRPFGNTVPHTGQESDYADALKHIDASIVEMETHAASLGISLRLKELREFLGLDSFASQILIIALAPSFDTRYAALYAFLQDDLTCKWPSVNLILDILGPHYAERLLRLSYFLNDSLLTRHHLLGYLPAPGVAHSSLPAQMVHAVDEIASWILLGNYQPPAMLKMQLSFASAPEPDRKLLPDSIILSLQSTLKDNAIAAMCGIDTAGQHVAAAYIAAQESRPLLTLDLSLVVAENINTEDAINLLLRDCLLTHSVPYIKGWDSCLIDGYPPPNMMSALSRHPGALLIGGLEPWRPHLTGERRHVHSLPFPGPAHRQREALLQHYLQPFLDARTVATEPIDLGVLAQQFQLTTQQIEDTILTAIDLAAQDNVALNNHHLFTAARIHTTARLSSMASKIKPRYTWDDLILPDDQVAMLREMVNTIKYRTLVLDEWEARRKLVSSYGVTSLFVGSPGTGKTMAAEVMAGELEMDLYKIDLSGLVSKYIGETEKNLERVFSEADRSNAILFFDEADSIFGKRSEVKDARDRYANIEISYLLQRMESYNGVTVLATNLGSNLDEAFTRRLQFRVNFPDPDIEQRVRIWRQLFPDRIPQASNLDWLWLAQKFNLTGGNIRNVIVAAAYLAAADGGAVTMQHLLHAIRREMQKMGRMINEKDYALR